MAHAKYSPSKMSGIMKCAGRVALESAYPNMSNKAADVGTACHWAASTELEGWKIGHPTCVESWIDRKIKVGDVDVPFTEEMAEWTSQYVESVKVLAGGDPLFVEHQVDFSHIAGIPDQFGTLDAGIVKVALRELQVHDAKFGRHPVPVERNPQLMTYALGLLDEIELLYDIESVRLFIHQPRLYNGPIEWTCTVDELRAFGEEVRIAVERAEEAYGALAGRRDGGVASWAEVYLHPDPNDVDCAYCRAMPTCPAMRRKLEAATGAAFSVVEEKGEEALFPATKMSELSLNSAMNVTDLLEDWIRSVRGEVERRLLAGEQFADWGLELGRQGARKFTDEAAVEKYLKETVRLPIEAICKVELKSPTQLEKLTKAKADEKPVLGPRQWSKLQGWIGRKDPSPSVKPKKVITTPYAAKALDADAFSVVADDSLS